MELLTIVAINGDVEEAEGLCFVTAQLQLAIKSSPVKLASPLCSCLSTFPKNFNNNYVNFLNYFDLFN